MAAAIVRFRVDIGTTLAIGPGKIALLESIAVTGSLSESARATGMSYRRAWQLLDSLNSVLSEPVTRAQKGGHHGGGSRLTDFGRQMISIYRSFEEETQERARRAFRPIGIRARPSRAAGAAGPLRVVRLSAR